MRPARTYNETRTHLGLAKDTPIPRAVQRSGTIITAPISVRIASSLRPDVIFGRDRYDRAERSRGIQEEISIDKDFKFAAVQRCSLFQF
jgi:hypothetical protein